MAHPPIHFDSLTPDALVNDVAWWYLYDASFPANEREPREVILKSLHQSVGLALRARVADQTVGLATTHLLRNPPAVFLVYLAVSPHVQGQGLGRQLLEATWSTGASKLCHHGLAPIGLVTEIDPAADNANPTCARRLAFFHRQGLQILSRDYQQPPVNGAAPVPMWLLYRHASSALSPPTPDVLVQALYREKYQALNGIDIK